MDQVYKVSTGAKELLTIPSAAVTTVGELRREVARLRQLEPQGFQIYKNRRPLKCADSQLLTDVIKAKDQLKAIVKKSKEAQAEVKPIVTQKKVKEVPKKEEVQEKVSEKPKEKNMSRRQIKDLTSRGQIDPFAYMPKENEMMRPIKPSVPLEQSEKISEKSQQKDREEDNVSLEKVEDDRNKEEVEKQSLNQPKLVYDRQSKKRITAQQKFDKTVQRLDILKIPNAKYWSTLSPLNEEIAEALQRSGAKHLEPIVHLQIQKHVMKHWLKRILQLKVIQDEKQAFQKQYGALEYFFDFRLTNPVFPLKLLMENRRKYLFEQVRDWFDCDDSEILSQQEQKELIDSLPSFTDNDLVKKVQKFTKSEQEARKLVQISQNDLQTAIEIYMNGQSSLRRLNAFITTKREYDESSLLQPWEEQPFLYRWMMKYDNYLFRMRMQSQPGFYQVYALSLRHVCKGIFNIFIKNRPYIKKLAEKFPPLRKQEERPPKRQQEKHYIYVYKV